MRASVLALGVLGALALAAPADTAPAGGAWKPYVSHKLGIAFEAPGEIKSMAGESRGQIAGPQETMIFRALDNGIEYKLTVTNFVQAQAESATILGEAEFMFQEGKRVVSDTFARVEPGKDAVYGRKIVIDLPDKKGRTTAAFYFTKGFLYELEATAPANNMAAAEPKRFVESVAFDLARAKPGATELKLPE